MKQFLAGLVVVGVAFGAGWFLRPRPPVADPHPTRTDTLYYPLPVYESKQELIFEKGDDVLFTDTVPYPVVVERIVTDTQYVGWTLPWTWGVDRLQASLTPADTMEVSLHGIRVDSLTGVQTTARIERIWMGAGQLSYLEVDSDGELRFDVEPWEKDSPSVWRWIERAGIAIGFYLFGAVK